MITIIPKGVVETTKNKTYQRVEMYGLSTDTKPTQIGENYVGNGSLYIEMDGGKIYFYDSINTRWLEFGGEPAPEPTPTEPKNVEFTYVWMGEEPNYPIKYWLQIKNLDDEVVDEKEGHIQEDGIVTSMELYDGDYTADIHFSQEPEDGDYNEWLYAVPFTVDEDYMQVTFEFPGVD